MKKISSGVLVVFFITRYNSTKSPSANRRFTKAGEILEVGRPDDALEEQPEPHEIISYLASRTFGLFEKSAPLYLSGTSLQNIADQLQVSKNTVRKALSDGGIAIRPHFGTHEGTAAVRERRSPGTCPPYGYAYLDGKLTVHPKEIQVVRRIVQMRNKGISYCDTAKQLNAKSVATRNGRKWEHSIISRIIRRESEPGLKKARGEV